MTPYCATDAMGLDCDSDWHRYNMGVDHGGSANRRGYRQHVSESSSLLSLRVNRVEKANRVRLFPIPIPRSDGMYALPGVNRYSVDPRLDCYGATVNLESRRPSPRGGAKTVSPGRPGGDD